MYVLIAAFFLASASSLFASEQKQSSVLSNESVSASVAIDSAEAIKRMEERIKRLEQQVQQGADSQQALVVRNRAQDRQIKHCVKHNKQQKRAMQRIRDTTNKRHNREKQRQAAESLARRQMELELEHSTLGFKVKKFFGKAY